MYGYKLVFNLIGIDHLKFKVNTGSQLKGWAQKRGGQAEKKLKSQPMDEDDEYAQLSPGRVRCLHELKIKQVAQLQPKIDNHWKRVSKQDDIMAQIEELVKKQEEKRQKCQDLDTQLKFRKYHIPEIHDDQKFENEVQEIQCKVEEFEEMKRKANDDSQATKKLIEEMESLSNETMAINKDMKECNMMIESDAKEIQPMTRELECPPNANDIVDYMYKINGIGENIEKWAEGCQSLEEAVCMWRNKNDSLEEKMKQMVSNVSLRNQKATDIEEHVSFLNLKLEVDRKMTDHWEKITQRRYSNSLRKQQKEELWNCLQKHGQKMDHYQTRFPSKFQCSKKDFKNADTRQCSNPNLDNENIKHVIEDIETKFNSIEQLGEKIQNTRNEISYFESTLEMMDLGLKQKCEEEVKYPENKYIRKEYRKQLEDLSPKLDKWSEKFQLFEEEHDQWTKKKSELEEKMKSAEQYIDEREEQIRKINCCIICLNRMIDAEEKMKEHMKMVAELIPMCEEKKDAESRWYDFKEKKIEEDRNVIKLDKIKGELKKIRDQKEKQAKKLKTVSSYLSEITYFNKSKDTEFPSFQFELIPPSNVEVYQEKDRLERWSSGIEKKYQELKQKNEKLKGLDNVPHIEKHLGIIEYFSMETDSCNKDIKKIVSAWRNEKIIFDNDLTSCTGKIKDQNELISKMEKQIRSLNLNLNPDEMIKKDEIHSSSNSQKIHAPNKITHPVEPIKQELAYPIGQYSKTTNKTTHPVEPIKQELAYPISQYSKTTNKITYPAEPVKQELAYPISQYSKTTNKITHPVEPVKQELAYPIGQYSKTTNKTTHPVEPIKQELAYPISQYSKTTNKITYPAEPVKQELVYPISQYSKTTNKTTHPVEPVKQELAYPISQYSKTTNKTTHPAEPIKQELAYPISQYSKTTNKTTHPAEPIKQELAYPISQYSRTTNKTTHPAEPIKQELAYPISQYSKTTNKTTHPVEPIKQELAYPISQYSKTTNKITHPAEPVKQELAYPISQYSKTTNKTTHPVEPVKQELAYPISQYSKTTNKTTHPAEPIKEELAYPISQYSKTTNKTTHPAEPIKEELAYPISQYSKTTNKTTHPAEPIKQELAYPISQYSKTTNKTTHPAEPIKQELAYPISQYSKTTNKITHPVEPIKQELAYPISQYSKTTNKTTHPAEPIKQELAYPIGLHSQSVYAPNFNKLPNDSHTQLFHADSNVTHPFDPSAKLIYAPNCTTHPINPCSQPVYAPRILVDHNQENYTAN